MDLKYEYDPFQDEGTGTTKDIGHYKFINYPFDKYEIKIKLSDDNKFLGIIEIKINKEFLSHKQKTISKGFHDVDDFYQE